MERLTGLDASFLYLETPTMLLNIGFAVKVDPAGLQGWSFQTLFDHVARRARTEPAFRRRLVQVPFGLDHPRWVEDPEFDVLSHLRHVALPQPGDDAELGATTVVTIAGREITSIEASRLLTAADFLGCVFFLFFMLFFTFTFIFISSIMPSCTTSSTWCTTKANAKAS